MKHSLSNTMRGLIKSLASVFIFVFVFVFSSCTQEDRDIPFEGSTNVSFNLHAQSITPMTRADAVKIGTPTYLIILDYKDGILQGTYTRGTKSGDIDGNVPLSPLSLPLTYGNHTLYFLTSVNRWDALDTDAHTISWSTTKLQQTWATSVTVNVDKVAVEGKDVSMPMVVGVVLFTFNDAIPSDASRYAFSISKSSWTYDYFKDSGTAGEEIAVSDKLDSQIGKTNVRIGIYSFVPSDAADVTINDTKAKNIGTATVSVVDTEGNHINATKAPVTVENVGILPGYQTNLLGNFWGYKSDYTPTIQKSWTGQFDISY